MTEHERPEPPLPYATPRPPRPWWVKLGLWGVPGRTGAFLFLWFSVAIALVCVPMSRTDIRWLWGLGFLLSALWYWLCIRWMDRHHAWSSTAVGRPDPFPADRRG